MSEIFAVIRIKGPVGVRKDIRDTLKMLRLTRVNHCVLVSKNPTNEGMLRKAGDYITWGEIDSKSLEVLISKRGRMERKKIEEKQAKEIAKKILKEKDSRKIKGLDPVFRLGPPSGGYRSVRMPYPGGSLGYRGEKINMLLKRMV